MSKRVMLNDGEINSVVGGSYDFNHDTGILNVGDANHASRYQITANYDVVQTECDKIFNGSGTDAEKNAKVIKLIEENNFGTCILKV